MEKYKKLDKDLKKIRHKWEYDLYEENLESQKRIDKFYDEEDISENDMICRKYQLELYLNRRNILFFPIIITIIFGLLVNIVFNKIGSMPNFAEMFQKLQNIPTTAENMFEIIKLYALLIALFVLVVVVFISVFFIPFPPLYFVIEIGENKVYQREYELKILEDKINKKIADYKNGEIYKSNVREKPKIKYAFLVIIMIIISIVIGKYWGLTCDKILLMDLIGIMCGLFITKIDVNKIRYSVCEAENEFMSLYDKNLEGTDEIFNTVKEVADKESLGNKIGIVRMFSAAKREHELNQLKDKFKKKSERQYIREVIIIDEQSAIVVSRKDGNPKHGFCYQPIILSNYSNVLYETMDQALIGMVCLKTDNLNACRWINKMLGIDTEN